MKSKKIIIIYPTKLFPTVMMSERRALSQVFSLAKDHIVDVATFVKNEELKIESQESFAGKINEFISIRAINNDGQWLRKNFYNLKFLIFNRLFGIRIAVSNFSSKYSKKSIINIINKKKYDIIISHYWWSSFFFLEEFSYNPIKIIDLHAMVDEDMILNRNSIYYRKNHNLEEKTNKKNLKYQKMIFRKVDLVIPNSINQVDILKENYSDLAYYYCPNGQEMSKFISYRNNNYDKKTVLFYGSFGSLQNQRAFNIFYKNVWPQILRVESETKLLVVGNKPSEEIKLLAKNPNITVTGYVEDIRGYIAKACCMVLPMDIGVGFRGRVVEVMALGIPVIGNHNALDCIGLDNEVNGFITDNYEKMTGYVLKLIQDANYRNLISKNSIRFIDKNYSMNNTFDKLSLYLSNK